MQTDTKSYTDALNLDIFFSKYNFINIDITIEFGNIFL